MSVFGDLKSDGLEKSEDRLGGSFTFDTDIYLLTVKALYAGKAASGARNVTLVATLPDGREYTETVYVTNKKGENWFLNKNDNTKKVPLPGFTTIDDICLVTTGKALFEQDSEEKVVKVYDYDEQKELPKSVPMLVEVIGQQFYAAIVKQTVDKNAKGDDGEYRPTGETREENVIEKVFHSELKVTVAEAREDKEPEFFDKWVEKNKGQTRNKAKGAGDASKGAPKSGRPGGAPQSGSGSAPKTSLFKKG